MSLADLLILSPCVFCHALASRPVCATCRRTYEPPRPILIEASETNEADQEATGGTEHFGPLFTAHEPPTDPPHACAGPVCRTWGCPDGNP